MSIKSKCIFLYLLLLFILIITQQSYCFSSFLTTGHDDEYEDLINQFKEEVYELIQKDFMKTNSYLGRWLKAYNNNLEETIEKFKKCLEWREAESIDQIFLEDFERFDQILPYGLEGFDKNGRPVAWAPVGTYDLRKITIAKEEQSYQRYLIRMLELWEEFIHEIGVEKGETNISQIVALYDLAGFNLKQGACFKCLTMVPKLVTNLEQYYPSILYRIYYVNTPSIFNSMLNIAKNFMSQATKDSIQIYDHNKNKWSQVLLQQIPADQLSIEYGGNKLLNQSHSAGITKGRNTILLDLLEKLREQLVRKDNNKNNTKIHEIPETQLKTTTSNSIIPAATPENKRHRNHHHHHHHFHTKNSVSTNDNSKNLDDDNPKLHHHHEYVEHNLSSLSSTSISQLKSYEKYISSSSSSNYSFNFKKHASNSLLTIIIIMITMGIYE